MDIYSSSKREIFNRSHWNWKYWMCVHFMPHAGASQNTSESFVPGFESWWAEGEQRYFQKKKNICFQTCDLSWFATKVVEPAVSIIQESSVDSGSLAKQGHPVELILQWPQLGESNKVGAAGERHPLDFNRSRVLCMRWQDLLPGRY